MPRLSILAVITCSLLAACGDDKGAAASSGSDPAPERRSGEPSTVSFTLEGNDLMKFDKEELRATAPATITVTLKNVGQQPKEVMGHNFVLLKPGIQVMTWGGAELLKAEGYGPANPLPDALLDDVIAHTKLLGPGEEDSVTFTIDQPGTYEYLCTFPGHYAVMKGKLIVE